MSQIKGVCHKKFNKNFFHICSLNTLLYVWLLQTQDNSQYLSMVDTVLGTDSYYFCTTFDLTHTIQRLANTSSDFKSLPLHERVGILLLSLPMICRLTPMFDTKWLPVFYLERTMYVKRSVNTFATSEELLTVTVMGVNCLYVCRLCCRRTHGSCGMGLCCGNLYNKRNWADSVFPSCTAVSLLSVDILLSTAVGTAAAAQPPFRPGNPALCGSRPLVTPY